MKNTQSRRSSFPIEAWAAGLLLLAGCAPTEASPPPPEPTPLPVIECPAPTPPAEADPVEASRDNCLACGRAFVGEQSKRFLNGYSKAGS